MLSSAILAGILIPSLAFAQAAEPAAEAAPAEEAAAEEEAAEAVVAEEEAAEEEAAEEEAAEEEVAEEEAAEEEVAEDAAEEEAAEELIEEVVEAVEVAEAIEAVEEEGGPSLFAFVDGYGGWQSAEATTRGGGVYAQNGPGSGAQNGFGLNWLGVDMAYDGGEWALNGSLRFGDAVATYGTGTLGPITNAYATWRPSDDISIDAGVFGTIYGAEVAESWQNLNYTRGELYFNYQPFWHTGVKAEYTTGDWTLRGLVANKANNSNLNQNPLEVGVQAVYDGIDDVSVAIGALQTTAPNAAGTDFVDTFADLVVVYSKDKLTVVGNADFNAGYGDNTEMFWGASLAAGYQFAPAFGAAVRGEIMGDDNNGAGDDDLIVTGTVTLDVKPVPGSDNFVVRWDNRFEYSEGAYDAATDPADVWFGSTVGFVAYADLL
jgi:hypothetical protein